MFSFPVGQFSEPSQGAVGGDAWVELFHLMVYLVIVVFCGGYGVGNVLHDYLNHLAIFPEPADGRMMWMHASCSVLDLRWWPEVDMVEAILWMWWTA